MNIELENISKRYQRAWILKDFSFTFHFGKIYGIQGINGSGKSTLLKILSGSLSPSLGTVRYHSNEQTIDVHSIYKHIAYAAAEDELVEELNITELLEHVNKFQALNISTDQFLKDYSFEKHVDKRISAFSSGMKQRLKLGLAICADKPVKLFDEPSSYLDAENKKLFYTKLLESRKANDLICIASNDAEDFEMCDQIVRL